jgi:Cu2+-exporting ATPase
MRQNLAWAVVYNASVMPLSVTGVLKPWMAALGMSLSSLLVVANAARLVRERRSGGADRSGG